MSKKTCVVDPFHSQLSWQRRPQRPNSWFSCASCSLALTNDANKSQCKRPWNSMDGKWHISGIISGWSLYLIDCSSKMLHFQTFVGTTRNVTRLRIKKNRESKQKMCSAPKCIMTHNCISWRRITLYAKLICRHYLAIVELQDILCMGSSSACITKYVTLWILPPPAPKVSACFTLWSNQQLLSPKLPTLAFDLRVRSLETLTSFSDHETMGRESFNSVNLHHFPIGHQDPVCISHQFAVAGCSARSPDLFHLESPPLHADFRTKVKGFGGFHGLLMAVPPVPNMN